MCIEGRVVSSTIAQVHMAARRWRTFRATGSRSRPGEISADISVDYRSHALVETGRPDVSASLGSAHAMSLSAVLLAFAQVYKKPVDANIAATAAATAILIPISISPDIDPIVRRSTAKDGTDLRVSDLVDVIRQKR
jgi:hypothetical protein